MQRVFTRPVLAGWLLAGWVLAGWLAQTGTGLAEPGADPDPSPALADLYRRADQHLQVQLVEARRLAEDFRDAYVPDDIRAPVSKRPAKKEYDDFREWISELRKAAWSHRDNARQVGRFDDWEAKMLRWGLYNVRLSIRRLWTMHLSHLAFEAGRIEAALADPNADEARLEADLRLALMDAAAHRHVLAARALHWTDFVTEAFGTERGATFRRMTYEAFAWDLATRVADQDDPVYGAFEITQSDIDWLAVNFAEPNARIRPLLTQIAGTTDLATAPQDAFAAIIGATRLEEEGTDNAH